MIKYKKAFSEFDSYFAAKRFVEKCDDEFDNCLNTVSEEIIKEKDLQVITLSGPTCSGKTTTSNKLVKYFEEHSRKLHIISIDNFYYNKDYLEEISRQKGNASLDYDSVDTIDLCSLQNFIDDVFDNTKNELHFPMFDFISGKRTGFNSLERSHDDIFLFEGIQALYPEVVSLFENKKVYSIYVCPESIIDVGGILFYPDETRLLRRLVRDSNYRATSPSLTFSLWEGVRENEEKNIFPYSDKCKYKIDSSFACEISLLKPFLEDILKDITKDDRFYMQARSILDKIKYIQPLAKEYISESSLYHEFI